MAVKQAKQANPFAGIKKTDPFHVKKKSKAKSKQEIDLGGQLDNLAAFKVMEKLLENEAKLLESQVKTQVGAIFAEQAVEAGDRPESFIGTGARASASCQIAKKARTSALSPEIIARLEELSIPFTSDVKVPARLVLNPDLDQETLQALANIVNKDARFKGKDVVMEQAEESISVVSDETIPALAALDIEIVKELLPKVSNLSVGKFQFDGASIEQDDTITEDAKSIAIGLLQEMGVLPDAGHVAASKKRKA